MTELLTSSELAKLNEIQRPCASSKTIGSTWRSGSTSTKESTENDFV